MDRFFSKLDLRDIKIDPEGSRFPPDADDEEETTGDLPAESPDAPQAPDWQESYHSQTVHEAVEPATLGHYEEVYAPVDPLDALDIPVASNGHVDPGALAEVARQPGDEVLKVSAKSRPSAVAGAIAGVVREYGRAEVQAIGAGATNQAVKAVAIAREYLRASGVDAVCLPAFIDVTIDNEDRTAIRLLIEPREKPTAS